MKAIFPCIGSLIMTKSDIENLKTYYTSRQISNNNSIIVENRHFNYFCDNSTLILDNVTPLTVTKLKKVLGINDNNKIENSSQENIQKDEELIDDDSIFSNPFFTTLKPVD